MRQKAQPTISKESSGKAQARSFAVNEISAPEEHENPEVTSLEGTASKTRATDRRKKGNRASGPGARYPEQSAADALKPACSASLWAAAL